MNLRISNRENESRPPHIYGDGLIYFLTARTADRKLVFNSTQGKNVFLKVWNNLTAEYGISVYHWILLSNHYHAIIQIPVGENLHRFMNRLHSITAKLSNDIDRTKGRKVWHQYWDHCIRNEVDFWRHFNYITYNPVKHGWCRSFEKALDYPFCGNRQWVRKRGKEFLSNVMMDYPIQNFVPEEVETPLNKLTGGTIA